MTAAAKKKRGRPRLNPAKSSNRMTEFREAAGYTQKELAQKIAKNPGFISQIETGERLPSFRTMAIIAQVLGKTVDEIFFIQQSCTKQEPVRKNLHSAKEISQEDIKK